MSASKEAREKELKDRLMSLRMKPFDYQESFIDDPFIAYQAAEMSKGKLCEHIANAFVKALDSYGKAKFERARDEAIIACNHQALKYRRARLKAQVQGCQASANRIKALKYKEAE